MYLPPTYRQKRFVVLLFSLVCKIRSGTTELSKPVNITVEVHEGKVEGRYSIDGKAEMSGFTFVVISAIVIYLQILYIPITIYWTFFSHLMYGITFQMFVYHNSTKNCPSRYPTSQKSSPTMGLVLGAHSSQWLDLTWMLGRPGKSLSMTCPVL